MPDDPSLYGPHDGWWLLLCAAALLGFVFIVVGWLRQAPGRRAERGLCPRCRYDIAGKLASGCPECGWNREGRETGPAASTSSPGLEHDPGKNRRHLPIYRQLFALFFFMGALLFGIAAFSMIGWVPFRRNVGAWIVILSLPCGFTLTGAVLLGFSPLRVWRPGRFAMCAGLFGLVAPILVLLVLTPEGRRLLSGEAIDGAVAAQTLGVAAVAGLIGCFLGGVVDQGRA
jgi:hypothetical protein